MSDPLPRINKPKYNDKFDTWDKEILSKKTKEQKNYLRPREPDRRDSRSHSRQSRMETLPGYAQYAYDEQFTDEENKVRHKLPLWPLLYILQT